MGLDMYLTGDRFFVGPRKPGQPKSEQYHLGYWRKHPNLHGYIVQTFAGGLDECQKIELSVKDMRQIIEAIRNHQLPETTGFFFGVSEDTEEQIEEDVEIFEEALKWREADDPGTWRSVYYRASW